jgi:hypothetical protein
VFKKDAGRQGERCFTGNATRIDVDKLTVKYDNIIFRPMGSIVQYVYCEGTGLIDQGIEFSPEIFVGLVDDRDLTAEECYEAAHSPTVPNLISVQDIWEDRTLKEDVGLCFETPNKNVVLLWIERVTADPNNKDLRTYLTTATQWEPR